MGESKQRKMSEPGYGKRPKGGRGIMIVPTFYGAGTGPEVMIGADLAPEQLRFGLCFWDRIAWPQTPIFPSSRKADFDFLKNAGVLITPELKLHPNLASAGRGMAESYFNAFQDLEEREPGRWSLAAATEFDIKTFLGDDIAPDRGITVALHRAVPIPTSDVPLQDLLEFKHRRDSELLVLRSELDGYKRLITSSTDRAEEFANQTNRIDRACSDLLAVSREMRLPVRIADMSMAFELTGAGVLSLAAATAALSDKFNFSAVEAFLASIGLVVPEGIKLTTTFGRKNQKRAVQSSPFRYVHYLHEELDWG